VHETESALAVRNVNSHDGEHEEFCLLGCVVWLEVTFGRNLLRNFPLPYSIVAVMCFQMNLIFMDLCIVDYSVEIPTRCSFVIEFIIPKFIEGSACFERHIAHHQEL
jgi:hypothetical protein